MKMLRITAMIVACWGSVALAQTWEEGIIVSGQGAVSLVPDMATVTVGVTERADTARAAVEANTKAVAMIMNELDEAGIAEWNRQTSNFYLTPIRSGYDSSSTPKFEGYEAGNQITVEINNLTNFGATLDAVIGAGANNFNGIRFGLKDDSVARTNARRAAVQDAMDKAQQLADAAGLRMGSVIRLTENTASYAPQPMRMARAESSIQDAVSEGQVRITVDVTMVFAILP